MFEYEKYLRMKRFPHIWCTGCGIGTVLKALLRAIDSLKLSKDEVTVVSGIGCSSRITGYIDFNTLHTTHGRAIAFATGVKLAKPEMTVIVVTGDGDATAIGGNHYIHAARRNIDMTVILFNNHIYGMTGGQVSPTTPQWGFASTAPYGNLEAPFNISGLAEAAGASFVARTTAYHVTQMERLIKQGIEKRGFSLIEVRTPCPTAFGRRNRLGSAVEMFKDLKENSVTKAQAKKMKPEQIEGKIVTGILTDVDKPEYTQEYERLIQKVRQVVSG